VERCVFFTQLSNSKVEELLPSELTKLLFVGGHCIIKINRSFGYHSVKVSQWNFYGVESRRAPRALLSSINTVDSTKFLGI